MTEQPKDVTPRTGGLPAAALVDVLAIGGLILLGTGIAIRFGADVTLIVIGIVLILYAIAVALKEADR